MARRRQPAPSVLTEHDCQLFLLAGGSLSLDDWLTLDPIEREAFARAGVRVWADRAKAFAAAREIPSWLDEGLKAQGEPSTRARRLLRAAVSRAARRA